MKFILICFFCLFSLSTFAQNKVLNLEECIAIALENNLENENSDIDERIAQSNIKQLKLSRFPEVSSSYNHGANFGRTIDPTTNEFNAQQFQSGSFSLTSSVTLYNGNRIKKTIEKFELDKQLANAQVKSRDFTLTENIIRSYATAVQAKQEIAVSENALIQLEELRENVNRLFNSGNAKKSDQLLLDMQESTIQQTIFNATNTYQNAIVELHILMQLPYGDWFDIDTTFEETPNYEAINEVEASELIEQAISIHPEFQSTTIQQDIIAQNIEIQKVGRLPQIGLFGNIGTNYSSLSQQVIDGSGNSILAPTSFQTQSGESILQSTTVFDFEDTPFFDQINNNFTQAIGISIRMPIFNRGEINKNIELLNLDRDRLSVQNEIKANEIRSSLLRLITEYNQTISSLAIFENQLSAQRSLFKQYEKEFNVGSLQLREMIETQNQIIQLEQELAVIDYTLYYLQEQINFFIQD